MLPFDDVCIMVVLAWLVVMVDVDGRGLPLTPRGGGQHRHLIGLIDGHEAHILVALIHRQGRPLRTIACRPGRRP